MRKNLYYVCAILLLLLYSMIFVSCNAITEQNININPNSKPRPNKIQSFNFKDPSIKGNPERNRDQSNTNNKSNIAPN